MSRLLVALQMFYLGNGLVTPLEPIGGFEPDSKFLNNLVPTLSYFGLKNLNATAKTHMATEIELIEFCKLRDIEEITSIFDFNESTILLIDMRLNWPGERCNWKLGEGNKMAGSYLRYWCSIKHAIIVTVYKKQTGIYPGINGESNFIHDSPYNMVEHRQNCSYFETRCDTDQDTDFLNSLQNGTMVYMETNESKAAILNRHWAIQMWFRALTPSLYFSVVYHGATFLFIRWRTGSLNNTQGKVLILNIVTCCILGTIEALGTRELTTIVPRSISLFFYSPLIGAGFAGDIWLSLMYAKLNSKTNDSVLLKNRWQRNLLEILGYVGILLDILLGILLVLASEKLWRVTSIFISSVLVFDQIGITSYQIYQTRIVIKSVAESNKHSRNERLTQLLVKLGKCMQLTIVSSVVMISILVYHSIYGAPVRTPGEKYIYWSLTNLAKLGSAFGQTYGCSPNTINTKKVQDSTQLHLKNSAVS